MAVDAEGGIGRGNCIPWRLSRDMQHFRKITTAEREPGLSNVVIMGRNTWESLPEKFRPLPGRINAVITSRQAYSLPQGVFKFNDLESAIEFFCVERADGYGEVFIIGGGMVYADSIVHRLCQNVYLTRIDSKFNCDAFFPVIPNHFHEISRSDHYNETGVSFVFLDLRSNLIGA